jgi:hypothetical protein
MVAKDRYSVDRSALVVQDLHDESDELTYWHSKTSQERLEALEQLRQILYGYDPSTERLQRFFGVAQQVSR